MPSKGFTVDTTNRNDVVSFYQAVYKASEGFETRTMWKTNAAPDTDRYKVDFTKVYTYTGLVETKPVLKSTNGPRSSGELHLDFVKDVERRVNFYRALAGVPAVASLMDNDTTKNSSTIAPVTGVSPNRDPALTVTKADAAQQSAYLISRTATDSGSFASLATAHEPTEANIPNLTAWSNEAWNSHRQSNTSYGFYGPTAIDKYMWEDVSGVNDDGSTKTNREVPHRRKILLINATNFATGDMPAELTPKFRLPANALYYVQRDSEKSNASARFVSYPNNGFFPAPLNSPYWSLTHPNADFTNAIITMTNSNGVPLAITNRTPNSTPEPYVSWKVHSSAEVRNITQDTTFHVTVSNFTISGVSASHSFSVTLINPEIVTPALSLTGSGAPPTNGTAAYALTPPAGADAIQINSFEASDIDWTEGAENSPTPRVIDRTYKTFRDNPGYELRSPMIFTPSNQGFAALQGGRSFRLTFGVSVDPISNKTLDEMFELDRDILPGNGGVLKFSYRRGYMTQASSLVVEITSDQGVTWQQLGNEIIGVSNSALDTKSSSWSGTFPASTVPYRVRFRYTRIRTDIAIFNHTSNPNAATGIFLDGITTDNCTWLDVKKTNDLAASLTKFTLNNANAGVTLTNGSALHLRARAQLGGNWMSYGPTKLVTPTSSPLAGFAGWAAYEYPELTGGFGGDHNGDGVANAVAFAFHLNPTQPSTSADTITRSADTISIERSIPSQRSGLTYKAEWSDTLLPGSWSQANVSVTFPSGKVVATAPVGTGKRFIRWKFDE